MANTIGLQLKVDTKEVKNADGVIDDFTDSVKGADNAVDNFGDELVKTGKKAKGATDNIKKTGAASKLSALQFKAQKNAAQQVGLQLQDVAVQAQMGTNALTIFAQQAPQIAGAFGTGGAFLGVLAAAGAIVGGVLVAAFKGATQSSEELRDRIDDVAESFVDLGEAQKEFLAREENKTIEERVKEIGKLEKEISKLEKEFERASIKNDGFNRSIEKGLSLSVRQGQRYSENKKAAQELGDELLTLKTQLETANQEIAKSTEEVDKLTGGLVLLKNQSDIDIAVTLQGSDIASLEADRARLTAINEQSIKDYQMSLFNAFEEERKIIEQSEKLKEQQVLNQNKLFEAQVENARKSLLTQEELEREYYSNSLLSLDDYANNKNLSIQERQTIEEQLTAAHLARLEELEDKSNIKRSTSFVDSIGTIETAFGVIDDLTQASTIARQKSLEDDLRNSQNFTAAQIANKEKEAMRLFELQKDASLNSIIASTGAGVMVQLATGNWGGAAKVGAAGVLNYAKVASTSYSSPAGAPSTAGTAPPTTQTNNTNSNNSTIVNFKLINSGGGTVDAESLQEFFKKGGILFDSDTEQAELLR